MLFTREADILCLAFPNKALRYCLLCISSSIPLSGSPSPLVTRLVNSSISSQSSSALSTLRKTEYPPSVLSDKLKDMPGISVALCDCLSLLIDHSDYHCVCYWAISHHGWYQLSKLNNQYATERILNMSESGFRWSKHHTSSLIFVVEFHLKIGLVYSNLTGYPIFLPPLLSIHLSLHPPPYTPSLSSSPPPYAPSLSLSLSL